AVAAHHDHERAAATTLVRPQERQAVQLRHPHIAEDDVEPLLGGPLQGAAAVALGRDLEARVGEQQPERLAETGFVVDYEDAGHGAGKNILNAAPPSRAESTQTTPPMSWTARATIASPR